MGTLVLVPPWNSLNLQGFLITCFCFAYGTGSEGISPKWGTHMEKNLTRVITLPYSI